jgi:prepilin-type processing-associated H-X9-DG protein
MHSRFMIDGVFSASSGHPGGVNVLCMDGSARFVNNGVNLAVWQAISTRAAGEVVSWGD